MERKVFEAEVKEANEKDLTVVHFISTEKKDRGGDIMRADGMKIKGKPVVLLAHGFTNMGTEPVAKPVWIKKGDFKGNRGIMAKTQFYPDDVGKRLWGKTSQGFMPNWSIGYVPLRVEDIKDGRDIKEWELLEYSPVGVPMNPDAQSLEMQGMVFKMVQEGDQKEEDYGELVAWKDAEGNWEEKPYANEHACRLTDPDKYIRIRRQNNKFGDGIHALWGVQEGDKPVELQAIRFTAGKFSADEAKSWLKSHDYKCKMFEPATGKEEGDLEHKDVIPYKKTPLADVGTAWKAGDEVKKAEVSDLKAMCVWFDSEKADIKTSYKGPHHLAEGEHACVWNGVRALSAVVMGARGGMNVPESDMAGIKRHVAGHYKDFDKGKPPWESQGGKIFMNTISHRVEKEIPITMDDMHTLAEMCIPDYSEFFQWDYKYETVTTTGVELTVEGDDRIDLLTQEVKELKEQVASLTTLVQPDTQVTGDLDADGKNLQEQVKKTLVIVDRKNDQDKKRTEIMSLVKSIVAEVVNAKAKEMIDEMRGKVK